MNKKVYPFIFLILIVGCKTSSKEDYCKKNTCLIPICDEKLIENETLKEIATLDNLRVLKIHCQEQGWTVYPPFSAIPQNPKYHGERNIEELPFGFSNLTNLEHLTLSYIGLKNLPNDLKEMKKLKILDISFNGMNISNQLNKIEKIPSLEKLILIGNIYDVESIKEWKKDRAVEVVFDLNQLIERDSLQQMEE